MFSQTDSTTFLLTQIQDVEDILYGYEIKIKKVDANHAIIVTASARDGKWFFSIWSLR
jgi:hypothetical protein